MMIIAITYAIISHIASVITYLLNWPLMFITIFFSHFLDIKYIFDFIGFTASR